LDHGIFGYVNAVIESDEIVFKGLKVREEGENDQAYPDPASELVRSKGSRDGGRSLLAPGSSVFLCHYGMDDDSNALALVREFMVLWRD
jgi:hypothetical protein